MRHRGVEVHTVSADVGLEEHVARAVDAHRERFGRMDVLVNNAGFGFGGPIERFPMGRRDLQLAVNLRVMLWVGVTTTANSAPRRLRSRSTPMSVYEEQMRSFAEPEQWRDEHAATVEQGQQLAPRLQFHRLDAR